MNLVKSIEQYNDKNTFFCEPIKNNIMTDGNFIRILYSTQHFILNGIYLLVNLHDITCEKFYNKYKCNFNISNHKDIIDNLKKIEEELLKKYNTSKIASYKIYEQMKTGYIKIFTDVGNRSQCSFILKISGIWETQYNYGLTYKFLKIN
jgi:Zn-dependent M16 (insulinase) family peptidase